MEPFILRIAIADDHQLFRSAIVELIEQFTDTEFQYKRVLEAGDGNELIERISTINPANMPNIVLLDLVMPQKSGFETIAPLRALCPDIKIIVLSARSDENAIIRSLKLGACGYVSKNAEPTELKAAIAACWTRGFYLSNIVSNQVAQRLLGPLATISDAQDQVLLFTGREKEFIQYACRELTYAHIAKKMGVSIRTIDGYRESLFAKLHVSTRIGLILWAIRNGCIYNLDELNKDYM